MRSTPKWDRRVLDSSMIDVKNSEHQWKFQIRHELSSYGRETLFSIFSIGMGEEFNHGEQNSYERGRGACFSLCISAWWIGAVYHIISGSARTVVWRKNTAAFGEQTNTRALCLGSHLSKQGGRKKKVKREALLTTEAQDMWMQCCPPLFGLLTNRIASTSHGWTWMVVDFTDSERMTDLN